MPKNPGTCFWGRKKPCGKHADSHPGFGQGPVSNPASPGRRENRLFTLKIKYLGKGSNLPLQSLPGFEPCACGVRRPCANPLGNLATVAHLAKASPDLSPHFQTQNPYFLTPFTHKSQISDLFNTQKPHFLTSFPQRKSKFSDT